MESVILRRQFEVRPVKLTHILRCGTFASRVIVNHPIWAQICIHDDKSSDGTDTILSRLEAELSCISPERTVRFVLSHTKQAQPMRAGAARNTAVQGSSGKFLALLDADDVMHPDRLSRQLACTQALQASVQNPDLVLIGCQIERIPADSTERYTAWANGMSQEELWTHQFRECTLLAPCWFMPRGLWAAVGGMPSSSSEMHTALPLLGGHEPLPFWPLDASDYAASHSSVKRARSGDHVGGEQSDQLGTPAPRQGSPVSGKDAGDTGAPTAHEENAGNDLMSASVRGGAASGGSVAKCGVKRPRSSDTDLGGSARFTPEQLAGPTGTVPEDLAFFLKACALGVALQRVDEVLLQYRHTQGSATSRTPRKVLQRIRAAAIDQRVCSSDAWQHKGFYIWGSGRDGRVLYKSLCKASRMKVRAFLDVSKDRIEQNYHHKDLREDVRVCHFGDPSLEPLPIVTAVALNRTEGEFEANLLSVSSKWNLRAGSTLWYFV